MTRFLLESLSANTRNLCTRSLGIVSAKYPKLVLMLIFATLTTFSAIGQAPDIPITFDDPSINYDFGEFNGQSGTAIVADPTGGTNMVLSTTNGDPGAFAGISIANGGTANPIGLTATQTVMSVDVLSPAAGIPVLLKLENSAGGPTTEVLATTTVGGAFETLTFDFTGDPNFNPANTYDRVVMFFGFNDPAGGTQGQTFFIDNIQLATVSMSVTCTGNVPIENLTLGMDYSITSDMDGNVEVVVTVLDNVDGLVAFYGGPGNPISFPAPGTRTFTYTFTGQAVGQPFVVDIFFNWAAGGQGNSETITISVGDPCPDDSVTCTGNVPIENLANGLDYTIVSDADGNVNITATVVDNPPGLVGFFGGPGNPISFPDASGTFMVSLTGQTPGSAFVMDWFFNWAAGGQGNSETVTVTVNGPCEAPVVPNTDVIFCVDLSCFIDAPLNPSVFGNFTTPPFDINQNLLSDPDGDGIWCATVSIAPGNYEYLFYDGNEGAEDFNPGDPCTTTNFGFTNRVLTVGTTSPQMETFGWESCGLDCVTPRDLPDLPITFDMGATIDYGLVNFGGMDAAIAADPLDPNNMVVCATKTVGATCFGGTTINPNGLANPIAFAPGMTVLTVDVLSPVAGVPFLLKIENTNGGPTAEVLVFSTLVGQYETLFFDFTNDPAFNLANTYNRIVFFPEFTCSTTNAPGSGTTYYYDNIQFCNPALPEITCPMDVTVSCEDSTDPMDTGMATTVDICGTPPAITFSDVSTQGTAGCAQYSYTITRTFTATDAVGNTAVCDQVITVEDTTAPMITCPMDVSGSCTDSTLPTDTGMATATDNCSAESEIIITSSDVTTQTPDGCGANTFSIVRTFTATDACGNTATCVQNISIADSEGPMITCPADQTLDCDTDPLPIANTIDEFIAIGGTVSDNCSMNSDLTISVSDFPSAQSMLDFCPTASVADRTLTRTYTITDVCGNATTCQQQFIYLPNTVGPVITQIPLDQTVDCSVNAIPQSGLFVAEGTCSDITYSVSGPSTNGTAGCPGSTIQYTYTATDVCGRSASHVQTYTLANQGPQFVPFVEICRIESPADLAERQAQFDAYAEFANVVTDCVESTVTITNNFNPDFFINQNCANPFISVDNAVAYQIVTFRATDNCGRFGTETALVVIVDTEGPVVTGNVVSGTANCDDADLQGGYTTWANFQISTLLAEDAGSPGTESISYAPLTANVNCAGGTANTDVTFTATDACGNATTLTANYVIFDSGAVATATVSGTLMTEEAEAIELVDVEVDGFMNNMMTTSSDGYYQFDLMTAQNYAISPSRNDNPLNGITTYDLIVLGQHLLEINLLDSPYKLIAADVNESGTITSLDLIELRRMILFLDDQFSAGKSWTFVDANYVFPDPTNPFATTYPTIYNINNLTTGEIADFIGVKLGDLNASASTTLLQSGDTRSSDGTLNIKLEDEMLQAGQTYDLAFTASDFKDVAGFQFTLDFAADYLQVSDYEGSELSKMSADNFGFAKANQGKVTVSWNETTAINMADDATLFTLSFTALQDAQLSEVLAINSSLTASEAYQADLRKEVKLDFGTAIGNGKEFALLQNQPNPFVQETLIGFQLPEASEATLTIFDVSGQVVLTTTKTYEAGLHQVMLDKAKLGATGVLYYQLSTPEFTDTKKMIVLQ